MAPLAQYIEEIRLGVVHDPHTERTHLLTEQVTVCPACRGLHTLRQLERIICCVACRWKDTAREPAITR